MLKKINNFSYFELGSPKNPTILFLPGYSNSCQMFNPLAKYLSSHYHFLVLAYPFAKQPKQIFNLHQLTNHINEFVQLMKLDKFYLVGFSFGGLVATKYAVAYPKKIAGLYLLGILPQLSFLPIIKKIYQQFKPLLITPTFCRFYSYLNTSKVVRRLYGTEPITNASLRRMEKYPVAIFGTLFNCLDENLTSQFNQLKLPKTIVLFKDDKIVKLKKINKHLPKFNCLRVIFDQGGHGLNQEYWQNIASLWK